MKPSKNSYYCVDCKRSKMLFPSKAKAERFMEYNSDEIYEETGHRPVRAYFCIACGGWHITSQEDSTQIHSAVDKYFQDETELRDLMKSLGMKVSSNTTLANNISCRVAEFCRHVEKQNLNVEVCQTKSGKLMTVFDRISRSSFKNKKEIQNAFNRFVDSFELFLKRKDSLSENQNATTI